jgi:type I restriction enzyme R subunit
MATLTPEEKARETIDHKLGQAGWAIQDRDQVNLAASLGVAVREVSMSRGHGESDYLLYVDGKVIGTVEAKPEGWTLRGVESQSEKYLYGVPRDIPAWKTPLPFAYESTGAETHFTNKLDPVPTSREVFAFHRPETLLEWVQDPTTLRARLRALPPLIEGKLWPVQVKAIKNLETSLAANRPRALVQMATGSGKTYTAVNFAYRLIKHANAKRVLFLVDRGNLGDQTLKEFQQFVTPDDGRKFTELYNVQHLQSNHLDDVSRVCIGTIQRLYSMLKGEPDFDPELDERSGYELEEVESLFKEQLPVEYNPAIPIETFDVIIVDECHRSIYNLWRQVLEYFDAFIIGLTATPSKQTLGFFNKNLVMEYNHEMAIADAVNVPYDVYRIKTKITDSGSKVEAGFFVDRRHRKTRKLRWEQLDEDFLYDAKALDRDVVAEDQIRTVIRTFRDKLFTEIFPGRKDVPKTLIFAKDDNHAEDIVKIVREEFGQGNDFCQKITYRTTGAKPKDLIASFRNSYNPRIAVTVDMIATGTDIKPLEIVFFMRAVKSLGFFEQMKGRGVRVIPPTEFQGVTPDAKAKTHFVIVDAVGVCEQDKTDSRPLERKRKVSFEKLLEAVALGNREADVIQSLAVRLVRLDRELSPADQAGLAKTLDGTELKDVIHSLMDSLDPDRDDPELMAKAVQPIATRPDFRAELIRLRAAAEQTIDNVSQDSVLEAGYSQAALEAARNTVRSFEQYVSDHKSDIEALQILYSRPYRRRLTFDQIRELASNIEKPPRNWTPDRLWRAYEQLEKSKVKGSGPRVLADLVSLVKFAIHQEPELKPFPETVHLRFESWIAKQGSLGRRFTAEQRQWLDLIRDHISTSLAITKEDFDNIPFNQRGGLGKAAKVFGPDLTKLLDELNEALVS